jgi:hypothetical protein
MASTSDDMVGICVDAEMGIVVQEFRSIVERVKRMTTKSA